jgi:hypothetical protein
MILLCLSAISGLAQQANSALLQRYSQEGEKALAEPALWRGRQSL